MSTETPTEITTETEDTTVVMTTISLPCNYTDSCEGHYNCSDTGSKICLDGWTGPDCTDRDFTGGLVDPQCPRFGCRSGGTCFDGTCCCVPGYTGANCQSEILECLSLPCRNGGFCNDFLDFYTCTCLPGQFFFSLLVAITLCFYGGLPIKF